MDKSIEEMLNEVETIRDTIDDLIERNKKLRIEIERLISETEEALRR